MGPHPAPDRRALRGRAGVGTRWRPPRGAAPAGVDAHRRQAARRSFAARLRADLRLGPDAAGLGAVRARRGVGPGRGGRRELGPRAVAAPAVPGRRVVPVRLLEPVGVGGARPGDRPDVHCGRSARGDRGAGGPAPAGRRVGIIGGMRLSARVDYALRAVAELASATGGAAGGEGRPVTAERLAQAQGIPPKFLESILLQLRRAGIVTAQRGPDGGYRMARPAEVIRVIDGPLANVRGQRPEDLGYYGAAAALQEVWIALRASEREILELVTIADVVSGDLPDRVRALTADPGAWV